jgi:hypothetical protein
LPAEGLNLSSAGTAFAQLVGSRTTQCSGSRTRVVAGDDRASYLVAKVTGIDLCAGRSMPPGVSIGLSAAQIETIRAWILAGAAP